jgi:hypothetical protein
MTQPLKNEDWRVIAAQARQETDPDKLTRLVAQLCESFDERDKMLQQKEASSAN